MTDAYTEDILKSLTKPQIINLFLEKQETTNSTFSKFNDIIRDLNADFKRLESNVEVGKNVNDVLLKQVPSFECH